MPKKPQLCELAVDQLQRGRYQPRRDFDQDALAELADSIRSSGLIQPIVVRRCGEYVTKSSPASGAGGRRNSPGWPPYPVC